MIVDYCGGRQTEVVENINAYSDMEQYYRPMVGDDGSLRHDLASAASSNCRSRVSSRPLRTRGLTWATSRSGFTTAGSTRCGRSACCRAILRSEKARAIFLNEGARKAEAALERPDLDRTLQEAELGQVARGARRSHRLAAVRRIPAHPKRRRGRKRRRRCSRRRPSLNELIKNLGLAT